MKTINYVNILIKKIKYVNNISSKNIIFDFIKDYNSQQLHFKCKITKKLNTKLPK